MEVGEDGMNCIKVRKRKIGCIPHWASATHCPFRHDWCLCQNYSSMWNPARAGEVPELGTLAGTTHSAVYIWRSTKKYAGGQLCRVSEAPMG